MFVQLTAKFRNFLIKTSLTKSPLNQAIETTR
ncbi:hypothetical protein AGR7B_Cc10488 [Agrobacterium deltaense RV3]|nr:hypothetical protein AGR7B_Cc10488 [Agrobacterium deltaense RV3]